MSSFTAAGGPCLQAAALEAGPAGRGGGALIVGIPPRPGMVVVGGSGKRAAPKIIASRDIYRLSQFLSYRQLLALSLLLAAASSGPGFQTSEKACSLAA